MNLPKASGWGRQKEREPRQAPINTKAWGKTAPARQAPVSTSNWGAQTDSPPIGSFRPKWWLIVPLCLVFVAGSMAWGKLSPLIEQKYLIRKARDCFARHDESNLQVRLARVLTINPDNVEASRLAADTLMRHADPQAILWRRRVAQLAPENMDDQLALAEALLRFDRVADAGKLLESIGEKAGSSFNYQYLAGVAAERLGRGGIAESHFAQAVALNPQDPVVPLRLAIVRLQSPRPDQREEARDALEKLMAEPASKIVAMRALILDALRENRSERALSLAQELQAARGSSFTDRLLYLKILQMTGRPDFAAALAATQEKVARQPGDLAELLGWMNSNDLALFAANWMHNLTFESDLPIAVHVRMAESFARISDWTRLSALLTNANWGTLDFVREAFLARSADATGNFVSGHSTWEAAILSAPSGGKELEMLVSMAEQWGWKSDAAEALWQMAEKSDDPIRALTLLYTLYLEERDTDGLCRVLTKLVRHAPKDDAVRNNLAMVSLLLDRDKVHALEVARELHSKMPKNAAYASTYAFALYRNSKAPQGLQVLNELTQQQRDEPSVAAYCCVLLAANARFSEAESYLKHAKNARLLPQEERLLRDLDIGGDKP